MKLKFFFFLIIISLYNLKEEDNGLIKKFKKKYQDLFDEFKQNNIDIHILFHIYNTNLAGKIRKKTSNELIYDKIQKFYS